MKKLTPHQEETLVKKFQGKLYLEPEEKSQLAISLGISERKIAEWFRNKRMKRKKEMLCKYKHLL